MKKAGIALTFILGLLLSVTIWFLYINVPKDKSADLFQPDEITGTLEADETDINVKTPGRVTKIFVEEGDQVQEGQMIAILDAESIEAKVNQVKALEEIAEAKYKQSKIAYDAEIQQSQGHIKQADAVFNSAKAQLQKAKNGTRPQQIRQAAESVAQAKKAWELSKSTLNRMEKLHKSGVIADDKIDLARTDESVSAAKYKAALQQLDLLKEGAQREDITSAESLVTQAQAGVNLANVTKLSVSARQQDMEAAMAQKIQTRAAFDEAMSYLKDATLKSPVTGIVTMKSADNGELVSTGMPVVTISNLKSIWATVKVRETMLSKFQFGQTVDVKIPGADNKIFKGKIINIASKPSYATERANQEKGERDIVSFGLKIKLNNDDLKLKPGMSAIINLKNQSGNSRMSSK